MFLDPRILAREVKEMNNHEQLELLHCLGVCFVMEVLFSLDPFILPFPFFIFLLFLLLLLSETCPRVAMPRCFLDIGGF